MSFKRRLDKEDVLHIYYGILLSHIKRWNIAICNNIDGSGEYYANKISQSAKPKNHMTSLICENKIETHRHRKQNGGYQREGVGR